MKKNGAQLAVFALEQIGVQFTFGIPGVHNIELYDALNSSEKITPILTTHENGASFMADAISRTSESIGVAMIVPAAGATNAMSGIGEAYLDGIASMIISGGTRRDSGRHYQLHQMDQGRLLDGIVKKYYLIEKHEDIIPTIYDAFEEATSGEPGPVFIEIPADLQMFQGEVDELTPYTPKRKRPQIDQKLISQAVDLLLNAKNPGLYLGWGAIPAYDDTHKIADVLGAPVATTLQGLSSFSAKHPLHTGVGIGPASVPAAQETFKNCDALLAIGCRFGELATGSYGFNVTENLIHVDINPQVFSKNYPAKIAIHGDSRDVARALLAELHYRGHTSPKPAQELKQKIAKEKAAYLESWHKPEDKNKVAPGLFFRSLRQQLEDDAMVVVDDGSHTFLTAELMPIHRARGFISPTDFNCMGYCVPAAIATKLANPDKTVAAIVGDGAFLMTGLEMLTASTYKAGIAYFVFHDGELGQISQFQEVPLNRKTCTVIGDVKLKGVADACGAEYIDLDDNSKIDEVIKKAIAITKENKPVLVDVRIDYSRKTMMTKGAIKVNLGRFPLKEKMRFIGRAIKRHVTG
ncbi:thiamine pyrophosphate-binding protein [bacterium]|nr:thiamine pyrophosphate-binding protein [bacterium]